ncbi:hypothetical protein DMUE_3414 [Dictyocoela muelleri]|nr:hypothetical protein DMUE_3414 [Dictyocoela muelleri]
MNKNEDVVLEQELTNLKRRLNIKDSIKEIIVKELRSSLTKGITDLELRNSYIEPFKSIVENMVMKTLICAHNEIIIFGLNELSKQGAKTGLEAIGISLIPVVGPVIAIADLIYTGYTAYNNIDNVSSLMKMDKI